MAIIDWPESERPRERLIKLGPQALSNVELLALFLHVGVAGKSAVDLARDTLQRFGSLGAMFGAPLAEFCRAHGLGPAKFAQLQAVQELAKRAIDEQLRDRTLLNSPDVLVQYLQLMFKGQPHESFVVVFLDIRCRLLATEELFRGTLGQAIVHPREVVKAALAHNAAAVVLAHNHPSGDPTPSDADMGLTNMLRQVLALVDVKVVDHIVVGETRTYSFARHGHL